MKRIIILAALFLTTLIHAADSPAASEAALLQAVKEVQAQQVSIADNQTKIDEKMAVILEAVRVARIYSSRSGH